MSIALAALVGYALISPSSSPPFQFLAKAKRIHGFEDIMDLGPRKSYRVVREFYEPSSPKWQVLQEAHQELSEQGWPCIANQSDVVIYSRPAGRGFIHIALGLDPLLIRFVDYRPSTPVDLGRVWLKKQARIVFGEQVNMDQRVDDQFARVLNSTR